MAISCSSRCRGWSWASGGRWKRWEKTSACEQQNSSWYRLVEMDVLNRFSAVLPALLYQYFWRETASSENQLQRTECKSNTLTQLQAVQRQPEDRFYSQIFQFCPALANSRKMWSKTNNKDDILTFSLAKTVNGVLQQISYWTLQLTWPYFLLFMGLQSQKGVSVFFLNVVGRNINMWVNDFKCDSGLKPQTGIIELSNRALYKLPSVCLW